MFRKLRFKLMLVNLSVIAILFTFLIAGTYFFVQNKSHELRDHLMLKFSHELLMEQSADTASDNNLAVDKFRDFSTRTPGPGPGPGPGAGPGPRPDSEHEPGSLMFFIKTNDSGELIKSSYFIPLTKHQMSELILQIQARQNKDHLVFNQTEYFYQKFPAANPQEFFIILQDFERDRNLLRTLLTGLSITGLVCMVLSLFGSLFMANKAMIPIQSAWQQQKDFLADASHEFRHHSPSFKPI